MRPFAAVIAGVWVSAWLVVGSAPVTAAADPGEHSHEASPPSRKPSGNSDNSASGHSRRATTAGASDGRTAHGADKTSHDGGRKSSEAASRAADAGSQSSSGTNGSAAPAKARDAAGSADSRIAVPPAGKTASASAAEVVRPVRTASRNAAPSKTADAQVDQARTGQTVSRHASVATGIDHVHSGSRSAAEVAAAPAGSSIAPTPDTARVVVGANTVQDFTSNAITRPDNAVVAVRPAPSTFPSLKTLLSTRLLLAPNGSLPKLPSPILTAPDLRFSAGLSLNPATPTWSIKPTVDLAWPTASIGLALNTPVFSAAATLRLTLPTISFPTPAPNSTITAANSLQPPTPAGTAETPYGRIGKWMINSDGKIANWIGRPLDGRTLYEPVNVILVDRNSTTVEEARENLIATLGKAGFPNYLAHSSTGYSGILGDSVYGQYPNGLMQVFSNGPFYVTNDHGRVFGPSPAALPDGSGYLWSMSISRESGYLEGSPIHQYVTFEGAEADLTQGLRGVGVRQLPDVNLDNVYNTSTITTGDNNGSASVFDISSPILAAAAMSPVARRRSKVKV
ncbi:hypothetical protein MBOL_37270 [Mycobacteroides abscessus subsp. bolletii BD]|nr:hypothetical protein MBOL_37270 [Mycobacteroides abscessus subsp. bolletii BD]